MMIALMASLQLDSTVAVLCLVFLVSCIFLAARSRKDGARGSPPPSPPALPVIGNLHQLGRGRHHRRLQALARSYGPLFLLRLGSVPTVVVSSPSLAEAVLKTQDHAFCSRPQPRTAHGTLYGCHDMAFSPYGERWRQLRRIAVLHLLSAKRVDSFRSLRQQEVMGFVERIRAGAREGAVNVTELVISLTNTVISKAAFGNRLGGVEPGVVRHMMKELTELLGTTAVSDVFPRLQWVDWATGLDARISRTAAELDSVIEKTLTEHEGSRANDGEVHDLLDGLLSIVKDGDQGFRMDRIDVKALILDMFIGGTDTIYKAIEWTMAELVKNPREMEKVQAEVRQVAAGTQGGVLEEELEKMSLLHAAMKEALRLHPPIPLFPHESIQNTRLHGYDIPAKTRIMINAWAIGRDSESWEEADEFRPERFMDRAMDYSGKDPRFIPFGAGRRGCPGIAFALRLAELTLANMMYHFDWVLPDGQDPESFEVVESNGFAPALKCPLILVAKPL
ncbi:cytochrome P450 71A1-like [Triticum dicoccoides]|uniref:cytochrome P450 71A1-like n=1 Tax=Triticum dicoccoides TaxID=85692 RepID=UPI00188E38EC|nr:cytochrome P450 71A1-like [Triticum dicoccoides]